MNEIVTAMAVRDLMNAVKTLSELPADVVKLEFMDLELVEGQLGLLLEKLYDRDSVRRLRQRSRAEPQAIPAFMAVREIPEA